MLHFALLALVGAIVAGVLGFGGLAGRAAIWARALSVVFHLALIASLVAQLVAIA